MPENNNLVFKTHLEKTIDNLLQSDGITANIDTSATPDAGTVMTPGAVYFTSDGHIVYDLDSSHRLWMGRNAQNAINAQTALSAGKLQNTSKIGDTNQPVYFTAQGLPVEINYTINKSVPANAVFTDTLVKQTKKTDSVEYKILTTVSSSPSSGTAAEAGYGSNLAYNPSLNRLSTGNLNLTGELAVTGDAYLNNETHANSITAGSLQVTGNLVATSFAGDGSALTNLSGSNIASGTIAFARLPTLYWANVAVSNTSSTTTTPSVAKIKLPEASSATSGDGIDFGSTPTAHIGKSSGNLGLYSNQNILIRPGAGSIASSYGLTISTTAITPSGTMSLGVSGTRFSKLYIGSSDSHGTDSQPIYWNNGVPAVVDLSKMRNEMGLSSAMHFVGITDTAIEDGTTTAAIHLLGTDSEETYTPSSGDVVLLNSSVSNIGLEKEYVWVKVGENAGWWEELGHESSFALSGHIHGNITNDGKLGTASQIVVTDTNKKITTYAINPANIVTATKNTSVSVAGTTKDTYKYNQTTIFAPNGLIMGGTAAAAGLVTRGICGVSVPDSTTGAATKDNLYINYDSDNTYRSNRQLILQAGEAGTHYGNNVYQYAAVRGDAMKAWVEAKGYITSYTNYYHTPSYSTGLSIATGTGINDLYIPYATDSTVGSMCAAAGTNVTSIIYEDGVATINVKDTTYESKTAASEGTDVSLVTTGEKYTWNNKQNALTTQTAYVAKGSSTKVAQITTNTLGQVTAVAEVDIDLPQVMRFI